MRPDLHNSHRREFLGWNYRKVEPLCDAEVIWHLHWARITGGPLLGLSCGTGQMLTRMVKAGYDVTGVDLSQRMLTIARANRSALPILDQRRMHLYRACMSSLDLGRQFGLIFIAGDTFCELSTPQMLRHCLKCVQRHLKPGGKLLVSQRRFDAQAAGGGMLEWADPIGQPESGAIHRRRGLLRLHRNGRQLSGKFIYETTAPDGSRRRIASPWSAAVMDKQEYLDQFTAHGLTARLYTDYQLSAKPGEGDAWCFVCSRTSAGN